MGVYHKGISIIKNFLKWCVCKEKWGAFRSSLKEIREEITNYDKITLVW